LNLGNVKKTNIRNVIVVVQNTLSIDAFAHADGKYLAADISVQSGATVNGKLFANGTLTFNEAAGASGITVNDWGSPPTLDPNAGSGPPPRAPRIAPIVGLNNGGLISHVARANGATPLPLVTNSFGEYVISPGDTLSWLVDGIDPDNPSTNGTINFTATGGPPEFTSNTPASTPPAFAESVTPGVGDLDTDFTISYTATKPSTMAVSTESISFLVENQPVFDIPPTPAPGSTVRICPGEANDIGVEASVPGDPADASELTITLTSVVAEDGGAVPTNTFTDNGDGTYTGMYTPFLGIYTVHAFLSNVNISNSPQHPLWI
jgi:hypothetical protein